LHKDTLQSRMPMCSNKELSPPKTISSPTPNKKNSRKKLWQLDTSFHCSVIGTCLTLEELRFIAKNHLPAASHHEFDYTLHSAFVYLAKQADGVTRQCQKRLDKKFNTIIKLSSGIKDKTELLSIWEAALSSGDIAGTYWMIVTHPYTDKHLLERAFGEVHMLSHLSGASTRTDIKLLSKTRHEKALAETALTQNNDAFSKRLIKKQNEIDHLKRIQTQLEQDTIDVGHLRQRIHEFETSQKHQQLQTTIEGISERLYTTTEQLNILKNHYQALKIKLKNEQKRTSFLKQETAEYLNELNTSQMTLKKRLPVTPKGIQESTLEQPDNDKKNCQQDYTISNLEGRNILFVGGRANQCPYFKALVEHNNGSFIYHDGGKEDSRRKLSGALAQADAILCPTDCISHDAYQRVKRHCSKQTKQLIMIAHASLSSFTQGLRTLSSLSQTRPNN
jgi:hypothetical protein